MFWFSPEFLKEFLAKNEHSFAKFYEDTVDIFYRYIKNNYKFSEAQIQDIISESYIKIWNHIDRFDKNHNIQSYCRSIVRNNCLDSISKNKEISFSELDIDNELLFEDTLEDPSSIQDLLEEHFQWDQIVSALDRLELKYKEIIMLKYSEDLSNSEIAALLWIQEDNVRQRLSRWLAKLKNLLCNS